jgi:RNA polymerase sigma-70 factor (ECF subfamily)
MAITTVMSDVALNELDAGVKAREASPMDEETFRAFYDRTARMTWVYLWRLTGDRQLADDLLQETYYRFFRLGNIHESELHRKNSLFCIATNIVRDLNRRRRLVRMVPLADDVDGHHDDVIPTIDGVADRAEARTDLAKAMATLKPLQREMLWLAYALGSSHAEIAEILGLKAKSVKTLLFRARKKMAALLRGDAR